MSNASFFFFMSVKKCAELRVRCRVLISGEKTKEKSMLMDPETLAFTGDTKM